MLLNMIQDVQSLTINPEQHSDILNLATTSNEEKDLVIESWTNKPNQISSSTYSEAIVDQAEQTWHTQVSNLINHAPQAVKIQLHNINLFQQQNQVKFRSLYTQFISSFASILTAHLLMFPAKINKTQPLIFIYPNP